MRLRLVGILVCLLAGCEQPYPGDGVNENNAFDLLSNQAGERAYFNEVKGFVVGNGFDFSEDRLESLAIESIDDASLRVSAALESLRSVDVADALIRAATRGVDVRVVTDTDRLDQSGFDRLRENNITIVHGDGAFTWQAEFGKPPVIRGGEDNRMVHNFLVFDHLRVLWTTNGFEGGSSSARQFGFALNSEDLARDFEDSFDQLYGGVFSTEMTFFSDSVSSDSNRRSHYPTLDGTLELYFGPQEPVVKEVIDSVYSARSDIWVATPALRNLDLLNALRYKDEAGFDVRILTAEPLARDWQGRFDASIRDDVAQTLIVIDGDRATHLGGYARGKAFISGIPLIESVPFFRPNGDPNANPVAQPSDQFIDGSLIGVHQIDPAIQDHFFELKAVFRSLYNGN